MAKRKPRVVALALLRRPGTDEILVSNSRDEVAGVEFQRPFGGGVDFGERGEDAVRRELVEELGVELARVRFAGVVENIYTFEGEPGHEILLLYEAELADPALYEQEVLAGVEAEPKTGVWRDLSGPDGGLPLYPPGLAEIVAQLG